MAAKEMVIIAPTKAEHAEAIFDLTGKAFGRLGYWNWVNYCREGYFDHSFYNWPSSRIGVIGGRVVTHWGVWDYRMRIGRSSVRVAGIGAVATDGDFLKRGLMSQTVATAMRTHRQDGYDMTILFGIWNFYHRFGYVRAWADCPRYKIGLDDLPAQGPRGSLHKCTHEDVPQMDRLYNAAAAGLTCTAIRPTYRRIRKLETTQGLYWVADGRMAGYVLFTVNGTRLDCMDSAGDIDHILAVLAAQARKNSCNEIGFANLHYGSQLATRLRRGNCRFETQYIRSGGPMIRLLDLRTTLTKIVPELSRRAVQSELAGYRGRLRMTWLDESLTVRLSRGKVTIEDDAPKPDGAIAGKHEIAQLIIGTHEPEEVIAAGEMMTSGDALRLARVLFPQQHPTLAAWDGF